MTLGATTWCICLRFGLVDCDGTATDLGAMQTGDGLFGIAINRHFNKAKPLGLTGISVDNDIDLVYLSKLAEHGCQFVGRHPVRQITYVNLHAIHSRFKVPSLSHHQHKGKGTTPMPDLPGRHALALPVLLTQVIDLLGEQNRQDQFESLAVSEL